MDAENKKQITFLGLRISIVFLMAVVAIIMVAYYVVSQNIQNLLTNYSIQLVQSMTSQGVTMVEYELEAGRREASILAGNFQIPSDEEAVTFPDLFHHADFVRMVYVSKTKTVSSDNRQEDIRNREDVLAAFDGEVAIYGPYYNDEGEYIICYTAPIIKDGNIAGVLSIEKDGYAFCQLIKDIRFGDTGESYILNAEGTDIAVSKMEHIDWVTSQYNSQKLYAENPDPVTKSILDLELKGLAGETGHGTYYWENGLVYVIYEPIPSVGWVLLGGLREEEIVSMTHTAMFSAISNSAALGVCITLFLILTALIIYWIASSMKKNAEINEKLEIIANHDSLTGLLNRRYLETNLSKLWKYPIKVSSPAAVLMMDIDNFKNYNDFYGHPTGDDCLRRVADICKNIFSNYNSNVIRYGGEEFLAVIFSLDRKSALELGEKLCRMVENEKIPNGKFGFVTVSVGLCHINNTMNAPLGECIKIADQALYQAKNQGKNRAILLCAEEALLNETAMESKIKSVN